MTPFTFPSLPPLREIERRAIDFVAAGSPWLAPAIPAYLVAHNAAKWLTAGTTWLDWGFVLIVALATEFIGLSAVHTSVEFWMFNNEKRKTDDPAPLHVAIFAGVFYIALVLLVNVVLEATGGHFVAVIAAKALLSLISVDAALIIALRAQHARQLGEIETEKREKKADKIEKRLEKKGVSQPDNSQPSQSFQPEKRARLQKVYANDAPNRAKWVAAYMAQKQVGQATAYRHYDEQFLAKPQRPTPNP